MRLERINHDRNEYRFYEVCIEPTLFGDHALLIRWGRIGRPSRQRIARTGDHASICAAAEKVASTKRRRGYSDANSSAIHPHQDQ